MRPEPNLSRSMHHYVLDDEGFPRRERDLERWAEWMQLHTEPLAETWPTPDVRVTTRFLGTDQRRTVRGAPVLWETMIFGGKHDLYQERYTSQADALKGHEKAVALAKDQSS